MFCCFLSLSKSIPEVINLTGQALDTQFSININSEAIIVSHNSFAYYVFNPESFSVEFPNGTTTDMGTILYIPYIEYMSYNYNLSIRCQGLKTLHAIIFKNNYKAITLSLIHI